MPRQCGWQTGGQLFPISCPWDGKAELQLPAGLGVSSWGGMGPWPRKPCPVGRARVGATVRAWEPPRVCVSQHREAEARSFSTNEPPGRSTSYCAVLGFVVFPHRPVFKENTAFPGRHIN